MADPPTLRHTPCGTWGDRTRPDRGRLALEAADPIHPIALVLASRQIDHLLSSWGYAVVFAFVALQSIGIPVPAGTVLVTAAIYAGTTHRLSIVAVIAAAALGAILGDNAGFALGRWGGVRLLQRYGHYVRFSEARAKLGRYLFMRHGGKLVFFGRFITGLRTWAAFLAGTNAMGWQRFLIFNAAGGIIWALVNGLAYFYIGRSLQSASAPTDIAFGVVALTCIGLWLAYLRRHQGRLQHEAELAFPGSVAGGSSARGDDAGTR